MALAPQAVLASAQRQALGISRSILPRPGDVAPTKTRTLWIVRLRNAKGEKSHSPVQLEMRRLLEALLICHVLFAVIT